ncbi:hypothetical protein KFU94_29965 [Chloroflexi bacterium TSY]|nr:hypothetical protein [Chloroflexi bacterium TSY]
MPQSIQLIIDGTAATAATDELLALSDLSATRQADENHTTKGDPLTIAVAIVGIVGTSIAAAEQIRQWYKAWRDGKDGQMLSKVIIKLPDGQRYLMKNITTDQLAKMLDTLK